jgi:hypothetical protein
MLCGDCLHRTVRAYEDDTEIPHQQRAYWWTDGTRYRLTAPSIEALVSSHDTTLSWMVRLEQDVADPATVPLRHPMTNQDNHGTRAGHSSKIVTGLRHIQQRRSMISSAGRGRWSPGSSRKPCVLARFSLPVAS